MTRFFETYYESIYDFVHEVTGDLIETEEMVGEVLHAIRARLSELPEMRNEHDLSTWVFEVMHEQLAGSGQLELCS